jgi:long-chain acyl-CoA synthetase
MTTRAPANDEPGLVSMDQLIEAARLEKPRSFKTEVGKTRPVAAMFFTSGTTGNPKAAHAQHTADRAQARTTATAHEEVLAYLPPAWIGKISATRSGWPAAMW